MKNYIVQAWIVILSTLLLGSCTKIDLGQFTPDNPVISFSEQQLEVPNTMDTVFVEISSNLPYRLKTDKDWVKFVKPNGIGSEKVAIIITRNREQAIRTAQVEAYITGEASASLTITQQADDPLPDYTQHFYVKEAASADNTGLSWEQATTLDQALSSANDGDFIHLASGNYSPTLKLTGGTLPSDITFEISQNIHLIGGYPSQASTGAISNPAANPTTLTGADKATHVVSIVAPIKDKQQVYLEGLIITKGKAGGSGSVTVQGNVLSRQHGGGMIIAGAKVELNQCRIQHNVSTNHVPGVYLTASAEVTMKEVSIKNNSTTIAASNGGGIWNDGSTLTMYDSEIVDNRIGGVGAGLYSLHTVRVSKNMLYNVTIANNVCGIFGNNAVGGGIYAREKSIIYLVNSTVHGNKAGGTNYGGGIALFGATEVTLINATVSANEGGTNATQAGGSGIHNSSAANNVLRIYNSLIVGNKGGTGDQLGGSTFATFESKSSLIKDLLYNYEGQSSITAVDVNQLFSPYANYGGYAETLPLQGSHIASTAGMSSLQLQLLGANHPSVTASYLLIDQNNKSRTGKRFMGAAFVGAE